MTLFSFSFFFVIHPLKCADLAAAFLAVNPQYSQTNLLVEVAYLVDKYSSSDKILISSSCFNIFC